MGWVHLDDSNARNRFRCVRRQRPSEGTTTGGRLVCRRDEGAAAELLGQRDDGESSDGMRVVSTRGSGDVGCGKDVDG